MTSQSTSQPSQQTGNFIVKVKLLTNQTFQIITHPDTLISQFKKLVQEKTKVPVDRQKIVFGGKSLIDEKPLKQYIHQSGLTVHLIAKSTPPSNTNPQGNIQPPQPTQNNNNSQSSNNNQQPNMNLINPFANLLGAIQNPPSDPNQFSLNIGNAVNSLFGNLGNANGIGIRVVHGTVNGQPIVNNSQAQTSNQNNQTNQQPQSNPSQNNLNQSNPINSPPTNNTNNNPTNPNVQPIPQNQNNNPSQNSNQPHTSPHQHQHQHQNNHSFPPPPPPPPHLHQFNHPNLGSNQNPNNPRLFGPLQQLQVSLNRVNNPYSLGQGSSLQQTTINYLKRMQSQMLRTAAQLNRNIHMLQEGQYMQLTELIPVFEALSNANLAAIDLIHRNQHQNNRMNNSLFAQNRQNLNQNISNQNNQNNPMNNNNINNSGDHRQMPEITATIIIEEQNVQINDDNPNVFENFIYNQMNRQPSNQQQSNNQQQSANNQQHLLNNSQPSNNPQQFNNPQPAVNQQTTQPKPNNQQNNNNQQENNIRNPNPHQPQPQPQTQTTQQPNVMNLLGNAMNSNGGFNFANIFAPQRPNNQNTFNMTSSNTNFQNPSNPQQLAPNPFNNINPLIPPNQQNPLNALQGINFMNLFNDNSNNQQPPQNPLQNNQHNQPNQPNQPNQSNQSNQPQNPLQGINIMGMLGNLQQGGGIGSLLGMSIGSMLQQQGQDPTIYSAILSPISGGQIMGCFTQKDFSFISRKRQQFRDSILRAISIAGSRQDLVNQYTDDLQNLLIPRQNINRAEICKSKVKKIIHRYVQRIVTNFLHYASEQDLTEVIMGDIKRLYCESIDQISKHTDNLEQVFSNMKINVVTELDKIAPGLSGMFYSIVERDLIRVYNDYEMQKKRKQAQSQQQAKDEADLLNKIQQASKQDVAYMSTYEHSKFYPQTKKQE